MGFFAGLFKTIKKTIESIGKVKFTDIAMSIVFALPALIEEWSQFKGEDVEGKIDLAAEDFDKLTGSDEGAIDVVPDLSPEYREKFWDHIKEASKILAKAKAKISPYYSGQVADEITEARSRNFMQVIPSILYNTSKDYQTEDLPVSPEPKSDPDISLSEIFSVLESIESNERQFKLDDQVRANRAALIAISKSSFFIEL